MNEQSIQTFEFENGLTLLVEEMPHVQSASFAMMVPGGAIYEPEGKNGTAAALCDLMTRGAGDYNSRQLSDALDDLGIQRSENSGWNFLTFAGATVKENVVKALPIYADILRRPTLPKEHYEAVMAGVFQSLLAEEDEPQRKALTELRKCCYDSPWGRSTDGDLNELEQVTYDAISQFAKRILRPNGTLIGVAGNVNAQEIYEEVGHHLGDWETGEEVTVERKSRSDRSHHIPHDSTQTHIAIAYDAVPYGHPDYYAAWAAVSILSGGSSSRLFTEVREKRGLCYSVYAALNSLLEEGRVLAYAGTTTERAQQTLDVMVQEMRKLGDGIEESELKRCKARAKSALIMQQESTGARAASIARDWFHLKRVNTLSDVHAAVEAITIEQIVEYACQYPAQGFTLLTIGEQPLTLPAY